MSVHLAEMGRSASRADMAAELTQRFESSAHRKGFQQTLLAEQQMLNGIEAAPLPPEDNHYAEDHAASDLEQNDDVKVKINNKFFKNKPTQLSQLLPLESRLKNNLTIIEENITNPPLDTYDADILFENSADFRKLLLLF